MVVLTSIDAMYTAHVSVHRAAQLKVELLCTDRCMQAVAHDILQHATALASPDEGSAMPHSSTILQQHNIVYSIAYRVYICM
eukprot:6334-Heterococcus_DN1.PRE.3